MIKLIVAVKRKAGMSAAELWFDSVGDKDRFYAGSDYLAQIHPDESRFADMNGTVFFVTEEETVL